MATVSRPDKDSAVRRIVAHSFHYLPATLLPTALSVVAVYIFTRVFTTREYGVYALVLAVTTPLTILVTEWAAQPITRFYSDYAHKGQLSVFRGTVEQLYLRIVALLVLVAGAFAAMNAVVHAISALSVLGALLSVLTQCFVSTTLPTLTASMRPTLYRRVVVGASGISTVVSLLLVYVAGAHLASLLWGPAIANATLLPWVVRWTNVSPFRLPRRLTPEESAILRRFLRYGLPMTVWFFSASLLYSEDRYMIGLFRGPTDVAVYGVNFNLVAMASGFVNTPVLTAVGPMLYQQWNTGRIKESSQTLSAMTELYGILAAVMLGGTMIVGFGAIHLLFQRPYWTGTAVLIPVMIGRLFWGASLIGHKTLELTERTLTMSASALVAATLNLVLNLVLVPHYGFVGSAYATLVSYGAYCVVIWFQSRKQMKWSVRVWRIVLYLGIAVLTAAAIQYAFHRWGVAARVGQGPPYLQLGVETAVYLLAFTVVLATVFGRRIKGLLSES